MFCIGGHRAALAAAATVGSLVVALAPSANAATLPVNAEVGVGTLLDVASFGAHSLQQIRRSVPHVVTADIDRWRLTSSLPPIVVWSSGRRLGPPDCPGPGAKERAGSRRPLAGDDVARPRFAARRTDSRRWAVDAAIDRQRARAAGPSGAIPPPARPGRSSRQILHQSHEPRTSRLIVHQSLFASR